MNSLCGNSEYLKKTVNCFTMLSLVASYLFVPGYVMAQDYESDAYGVGSSNTNLDYESDAYGVGSSNTNLDYESDAYGVGYYATPITRSSGGGSGSGSGASGIAAGAGGAVAGVGACLFGGGLTSVATTVASVPIRNLPIQLATGGDNIKNCLLDGMAFQLKEALVKGIIKGVIGFINSGFSGGAGYMQDQDSLFSDLQDEQFNTFVNDSKNFSSLCSAWAPDVRLALAVSYSTSVGGKRVTQISDTGTGTPEPLSSGEPEACRLDNDGYGSGDGNDPDDPDFWSTFLTQTTTTGGNPLTSFFSIQDRLAEEALYVAQKKADEITRGQGYFDNVDCASGASAYSASPGSFTIGGVSCSITTAASTIADQVNETIGSDLRRLELSDEFDEIFSQLVAMLIQMILGKLGLSGVSERSGGSASFIDQYAAEVNPTAVVQSRDDLLTLFQGYRENAVAYLNYKRQSLRSIVDAREAILNVYACYEAKYNTWIYNSSDSLVSPQDIDSVPESARHRATFTKDANIGVVDGVNVTTTILLTPEQTARKMKEYEALYEEVDGYIRTLVYEIEEVELDIAKVIGYEYEVGGVETDEAWLQNTISSSTIIKQIELEFENYSDTVVVATQDPIASTNTGAEYNLDDEGSVVESVDSDIDVVLSSVRLNAITFTLNIEDYDFPVGETTALVNISYGLSGSTVFDTRQVEITSGENAIALFNGLSKDTSYDFSFYLATDEPPTERLSVATNTTGTRSIPRNLTIEQITQTYTVALQELPVYDVAAASEQVNQVEAANDDLLLGPLQADGVTRAGGVNIDLQTCISFSRVYMPKKDEDNTNQR